MGPSIGEIWLQLGRRAFPVRGWTDFVFNVLGAFLGAFRHVSTGATSQVVYIPDGPFEVEVSRISHGWLRLIARERRIARRVTRARWRIPTRRFAQELQRAVEFAVAAGRAAGDRSREFRCLERELRVLRGECRRLQARKRGAQ